jgi:hypothetical protein
VVKLAVLSAWATFYLSSCNSNKIFEQHIKSLYSFWCNTLKEYSALIIAQENESDFESAPNELVLKYYESSWICIVTSVCKAMRESEDHNDGDFVVNELFHTLLGLCTRYITATPPSSSNPVEQARLKELNAINCYSVMQSLKLLIDYNYKYVKSIKQVPFV